MFGIALSPLLAENPAAQKPATPNAFSEGGGVNGNVLAIAVLPDGGVIVGGVFSSVCGVARRNIAKLNADGTLDRTAFEGPTSGVNGKIAALAVSPDGGVVAGGEFSDASGQPRSNLAKFRLDGSLDPSFSASGTTNGPVAAVSIQPDGRILVGGEFTQVGGQPRKNLARLMSDGTLDPAIGGTAGVTGAVRAVAASGALRAIAGGSFQVASTGNRGLFRE